MIGRIPVLDVSPVVAGGTRPGAAVVGELIPISALVFRDGHGAVAADAVLLDDRGREVARTAMQPHDDGTDRFTGWLRPEQQGRAEFTIEAWADPIATWRHRAQIKIDAGIDGELELAEGALLLERAIANAGKRVSLPAVKAAVTALRDTSRPLPARLAQALADDVRAELHAHPLRDLVSIYGPFPLLVERQRALVGAWYEFFPRSEGAVQRADGSWTSGTFRTAAQRLPAIAAMGFDVVYLPPIHPIGHTHRKGPNNSLVAGPHDPGSPWAIGAAAGGHDAIHPDLGDADDFAFFVAQAADLGIEVALDLALQCSPDHPWVSAHPEWFTIRADGSIAYAENPPKKYQDIYPLDFDNDPEGLYREILRVVQLWISRGVRIFRVDNPHTKPVAFWERLIAQVNKAHPDVIFLAEAFTRPPMMRVLAEIGFQQSYTYFTWRNDRDGLVAYLEELAGPASAAMRPNLFVNTPDILNEYLQYGGPAAFAIRATLAATLSPTWGVYSGFELFEHVPVRPGSEEYLDSEKFQYRPRDWAAHEAAGTTLAPYITQLNRIRREHVALQGLRTLRFHTTSNERLIAYSKRDGDNIILVVVALDPHGICEGTVTLDADALGVPGDTPLRVDDLLDDETYWWSTRTENYVRLDPRLSCAHIFRVTAALEDDA